MANYISQGGLMVPSYYGAYEVTKQSNKRRKSPIYLQDEDRLVGAYNYHQLRSECRKAFRNYPLVRAIHDRICEISVSFNGILPQVKTLDKVWNKAVEAGWSEWGKIADYRSRCDFVELQKLVVSSLLLDGDAFFILLSSGLIQPVEAERVNTPKEFLNDPLVINGVRVSQEGRIIGYYICSRLDNGVVSENYEYKEAKDVIHVRNHSRIDSIRGVPAFAVALERIIDLYEYQAALLLKAKGEAKRGFAVISNEQSAGKAGAGDRFAGYALGGNDTDGGTVFESILDGSVYYLNENEKIENLDVTNPGANHMPYVESIIGEICAAMGIAPELVTLKYNTAYIASKGALLTTAHTIEKYQTTLEIQFLQRVYNWFVSKQVKEGNIAEAPEGWWKVFWVYPTIPQLDSNDIALGEAQQWKNGTTTLSMQCKARGLDYDDVLAERIAEAKKIIEASEQNGIPSWMLLPPPAGLATNSAQVQTKETKGKNETTN